MSCEAESLFVQTTTVPAFMVSGSGLKEKFSILIAVLPAAASGSEEAFVCASGLADAVVPFELEHAVKANIITSNIEMNITLFFI
jgi:hypothetical protein